MTKHYIKIDIEKVLELVRDAYHMGAVRRVRTKEWFEWYDNEEKKLRAIPFRHDEVCHCLDWKEDTQNNKESNENVKQ